MVLTPRLSGGGRDGDAASALPLGVSIINGRRPAAAALRPQAPQRPRDGGVGQQPLQCVLDQQNRGGVLRRAQPPRRGRCVSQARPPSTAVGRSGSGSTRRRQ